MNKETRALIQALLHELKEMRERPNAPTLGHLERWLQHYENKRYTDTDGLSPYDLNDVAKIRGLR